MQQRIERFYTDVSLAPAEGGEAVHLDGRPVRTPAGRPLVLPAQALAAAVADEWRQAGEVLDIPAMAMTRLANAAIDHVAPRLDEVRGEALAYARSDVLCFRADAPAALRARQDQLWQPPLDWIAASHGVSLPVVTGLMAADVPETSVSRLKALLTPLDAPRLLVVHALTSRFASIVLALAVTQRHLTADEAFALSRLDELFQIEKWGEDAEAAARTRRIAAEIDELGRFLGYVLDGEAVS